MRSNIENTEKEILYIFVGCENTRQIDRDETLS